jgi:hypothetical protein
MRRSTGIYLVILVLLAGLYYYLNNRPADTDTDIDITPAPAVEYIFTAEIGLPSRIRIESSGGNVVEVKRNETNAWVMIQPVEAEADQGSVEAAASQVSTLRVVDRIPGLSLESVGLKDPVYTFTLQFTGGVERTLEIGVLTPTETGYYASTGEGDVLIVSNNAIDSLLGLLNNPPYAPTATPPPS